MTQFNSLFNHHIVRQIQVFNANMALFEENQNTEEVENQNENNPEENQSEEVDSGTNEAAEAGEQAAETDVAVAEEEAQEEDKPEEPFVLKALATPPDDFDWEEFEVGIATYSKDEFDKMNTRYDETLTSINEKEVIQGTIVSINKKEVVVNIGYKSEGVIATNEFRYNPDLKVGDQVEVFVESTEDKNGQLNISHKTARLYGAWERVNSALANDEVITGFVKCRTKGGLITDVFGLEAFLPGSQIDVKPIRDYDIYVGKNIELKVVKINQEFKNVVVSHKALIEAELEEQKKQIISGLEKGQVLEGTVKNITSYGVFIDLGGVDGLIHITDLSWGRINHPEEVVTLDEKINVVILDFDDDKKRIALGLKQLTDHPWDKLDAELKVGDKVKGKVVVLADYGAFIELQPGVEGLIHVSEMSWSQHLRSAQDFLSVGDEVEAEILTLDREERKMSLGMKQLIPDPWQDIETKYAVDSRHKGTIRNFTHFGVFVELEEGVDGLIHISDLSWQKKIKHPSEFCNIGDEIEVVILEVDKDNRRLSLGHKQLEENPWEVFETVFVSDSVHKGTVLSIDGNSVTVALPYGVEGFATKKHLRKEDGTTARVDEQLDFKVLDFNKNAKKIVVSHLRMFEEDERSVKDKEDKRKKSHAKQTSRMVSDLNKNQEKSTLGDLDVLSELKSKMEKSESGDSPAEAAGE